MANRDKNPATRTSGGQKDWSLYSVNHDSEQDKLDSLADEFLPMDLFIDPKTIEERYNAQAVRRSRTKKH